MAVLPVMYGLYLFGRKEILSYMFLKRQFVFFDFEQDVEMQIQMNRQMYSQMWPEIPLRKLRAMIR